jgi:nicotinamide riboside transporter PnuC
MGFKDVLVWLRSYLAEVVFLLVVLVVLLLVGYWAWAATPRAIDSFEQRPLKKELATDKAITVKFVGHIRTTTGSC